MHILQRFSQKNLHISKISSTFATVFQANAPTLSARCIIWIALRFAPNGQRNHNNQKLTLLLTKHI